MSTKVRRRPQGSDGSNREADGILARFTHPESLDLKCSKCNSSNVSLVFMSTSRGELSERHQSSGKYEASQHPEITASVILHVQGKFKSTALLTRCIFDAGRRASQRFKHDATAAKIDTYVRFPAALNMAPYTNMASGTDPYVQLSTSTALL